MPAISNSAVRVINPVLSSIAQGYANQEFVGNYLFPRVPVSARGGQILEFDRDAFRLYATRRAAGGRSARIQFGYSGKPFALLNDSVEVPIPREQAGDAEAILGIDLGKRAVSVGMRNMLLSLEVEQATLATTAANYGASNKVTLAGATKWSATTGTPITDVDNAREAIRSATGLYPNVAIMSPLAFNACKNNPNVVARFQYNGVAGTEASQITPKMLAGLFNIDNVVVGKGIYFNDANVATDIWGNNVVLAVTELGTPQMEMPSYGYTYTLEGNPLVEEPYWEAQTKAWVYGVTFERAAVLSGISSGYLIVNPN